MGAALLLPGAVRWNDPAGAWLRAGEIPVSCLLPFQKKPNPTANKKLLAKMFRRRTDLTLKEHLSSLSRCGHLDDDFKCWCCTRESGLFFSLLAIRGPQTSGVPAYSPLQKLFLLIYT